MFAAGVVGLLLMRVDPRWGSSQRAVSCGRDPTVSWGKDSSSGAVEENLGDELTNPPPFSLHCRWEGRRGWG